MPLRALRALGAAALLFTAAGCGSDGSGPTGPGGPSAGQASMTALLDGVAWSAPAPVAMRQGAGGGAATIIAVAGASSAGTISFGFQWIQGVDTYTIASGASASLNSGSGSWRAPDGGTVANPDGTSLTITVTSITDERIAGSFEITMKPALDGSLPETRVVTEGRFDVAFFGRPGLAGLPAADR